MQFQSSDALSTEPDGLHLEGCALAPLAARFGTPLYVYAAGAIRRRFAALRAALASTGRPFRIRYAMKSNRFGPVLDVVRAERDIHVDTCSPREIARALAHGFAPDELSLTAGMLSNRDLALLADAGVKPNLDTFSVIRRWAATPGRRLNTIGLRINPEVAVGWGSEPKLAYGNSKFGFDQDRVVEAAKAARAAGLEVDELHMHLGWGLQRSAEPALRHAFGRLADLATAVGGIRTVNVGGGLCWPHRDADDPMPLDLWATILRESLASLAPEVSITCEPGTYVMAASGVLIVEVTTVETRRAGTWVGVDAGHAVNVFAAHYGIPMVFQPLREPLRPVAGRVHIGGNINEANDVFARDLPFPDVAEGEWLALSPAGAYGSSMASDHCLRGQPGEVLVDGERVVTG